MRAKLAILFAFCVAATAAPAGASGGPAILGGVYGAGGVTVPGTEYRYSTIFAGTKGTVIAKIRTNGGTIKRYRGFGAWSLPAVTLLGEAGGLSADGRTLVLIRPGYGPTGRPSGKTSFLSVDTAALRAKRRIDLKGTWSFDAISPDGGLLYLTQYRDPRDPLDYRVRQYDLRTGLLRGGALVDLDEPDEKMTGQPVSRVMSPDGAVAYTLYGGGTETFIHALDTEIGQADCIDLEQFGPKTNFYNLSLAVDPSTGVVTVLDRNGPAAIVDPQTLAVNDPPGPAVGAAIGDGQAGPLPTEAGGSAWIGPAALGGGLAMLAAAGLLASKRRRRGAP